MTTKTSDVRFTNCKEDMRIETIIKNGKKIIAEIDNEDNSVDVAVVIDGDTPVTLNISVDDNKILIRRWIGYDDSEDEQIYIDELYEDEE